jgi:hypothetical protein
VNTPIAYSSAAWPSGFGLLLIAIAAFLLAGCAQSTALTTGPFSRTNRIDSELRRGVSSKSEVERILGKPNGTGGSLLPLQDRPREVWVYNQVQNKRIGTLLFLEYLRHNRLLARPDGSPRFADNAMVALALLVAESEPAQKDLMIRLILNLLEDGST